jgi:DNA topoisomerase-1
LIVEREKERIKFVPARWWDAKVTLEHKGTSFPAEVTALDGVTLAQGRDFGPDGKLATTRRSRSSTKPRRRSSRKD